MKTRELILYIKVAVLLSWDPYETCMYIPVATTQGILASNLVARKVPTSLYVEKTIFFKV